ncbi:MAG TPA: hypothetical protein VMU69_14895, partial [Bradyrhizobium sp.]|nr:hypothetical protein [Bradyrhizobium sp.]
GQYDSCIAGSDIQPDCHVEARSAEISLPSRWAFVQRPSAFAPDSPLSFSAISVLKTTASDHHSIWGTARSSPLGLKFK